MRNKSNAGVLGAALIGVGFGLTALGVALVVPAWTDWSFGLLDRAIRRSRDSVGAAADTLGDLAGRAQYQFSKAAESTKATTAKAAGAVENAARTVREYAS